MAKREFCNQQPLISLLKKPTKTNEKKAIQINGYNRIRVHHSKDKIIRNSLQVWATEQKPRFSANASIITSILIFRKNDITYSPLLHNCGVYSFCATLYFGVFKRLLNIVQALKGRPHVQFFGIVLWNVHLTFVYGLPQNSPALMLACCSLM